MQLALYNPQPRAAIALLPDCLSVANQREDTSVKVLQRIIPPALLAACLVALSSSAAAQSTIFNIPSTDVQAPGKVYLEADFITHFASYSNGGYQTYAPRVVVGLPGNTEVGVNVVHTRADSPQPIAVQPNFKWKFYANEKRGLAAATGVSGTESNTPVAAEQLDWSTFSAARVSLPSTVPDLRLAVTSW